MARRALKRFVAISRRDATASVYAQGILSNLGRHECNRTPLYKAALEVIIADAKKVKDDMQHCSSLVEKFRTSTIGRIVEDKNDPFRPKSPKARKDKERYIEMVDTKLAFDQWETNLASSNSLPNLGTDSYTSSSFQNHIQVHSRSSYQSTITRDLYYTVRNERERSSARSLEPHERKGYINKTSGYINRSLRKNGISCPQEVTSPWLPDIQEWKIESQPKLSPEKIKSGNRPHTVRVKPNRSFEFFHGDDFESFQNVDKEKERQRALDPVSSNFRLWEFKHVEGSKYSKDLFKPYSLPNGKHAYYFQISRLVEIGADIQEQAPPGKIVRFSYAHSAKIELETSCRLAVKRDDIYPAFDSLSNLVPHSVSTGGCKNGEADRVPPDGLQLHLRFEMPKVGAPIVKEKPKPFVPKDPWTLEKSIWVPRKKESEGGDNKHS